MQSSVKGAKAASATEISGGDEYDRTMLQVVTAAQGAYIRDTLTAVDASNVFGRLLEGLWALSFAKHVGKACGVDRSILDGAYEATTGLAVDKKKQRITQ